MPSNKTSDIAAYLPYLRRYARALSGSQKSGDAYVRACLQAILADPTLLQSGDNPKAGLFQLFHKLWNSTSRLDPAGTAEADLDYFEQTAQERLATMQPINRQALLLTTLEGFSPAEVGEIIGADEADVVRLVDEAISEIDRQTATQVLIIEDEPLISMDLADIVRNLGHSVSAIARTKDEAVRAALADRPGLVLADIQLADGSSGIDAVNDILGEFGVPVIFITSFPERLLTGDRPEPTFLITKPFETDTVKASISQAMFFGSTADVAG